MEIQPVRAHTGPGGTRAVQPCAFDRLAHHAKDSPHQNGKPFQHNRLPPRPTDSFRGAPPAGHAFSGPLAPPRYYATHRFQDAKPGGSALELLAEVVPECSDARRAQAPGFTFYCLLMPKFAGDWGEGLAEHLKGRGVSVLDYRNLLDDSGHSMDELCFDDNTLYKWGHFRPLGYDLIAQRLSRDIAVNEK